MPEYISDDVVIIANSYNLEKRWFVLNLRTGLGYSYSRLDYIKAYHKKLVEVFNTGDSINHKRLAISDSGLMNFK
jgi:hypothetical protein